MSFRDQLIGFIQQNLAPDGESLGPEDSLVDRGLMDSIGLMRVMQFVETEAGVRVPDTRVTPDNFESVAAIERLVNELRAG